MSALCEPARAGAFPPAAGSRRRLHHPDSPPSGRCQQTWVPPSLVEDSPDRPQGPWHAPLPRTLASAAHLRMAVQSPAPYARIRTATRGGSVSLPSGKDVSSRLARTEQQSHARRAFSQPPRSTKPPRVVSVFTPRSPSFSQRGRAKLRTCGSCLRTARAQPFL